jgi:hypothetical protein
VRGDFINNVLLVVAQRRSVFLFFFDTSHTIPRDGRVVSWPFASYRAAEIQIGRCRVESVCIILVRIWVLTSRCIRGSPRTVVHLCSLLHRWLHQQGISRLPV